MQESSKLRRGSNQEWEDGQVDNLAMTSGIVVDAVADEDQVRDGPKSLPCQLHQVALSRRDEVDTNCLLQLQCKIEST